MNNNYDEKWTNYALKSKQKMTNRCLSAVWESTERGPGQRCVKAKRKSGKSEKRQQFFYCLVFFLFDYLNKIW